jgi:thymidylate synthase
MKVKNIRKEFVNLLKRKSFVIDKTGVKTLEIINANFEVDENTIFGTENKNYLEKELNWYLQQSLNVNDIEEPIPKIWKQICSENGEINSNYGYLVFNNENFNQYKNVLEELLSNKFSRRAIMIYLRPSMHIEYKLNGMNDFICTSHVQYFIRNNKIICIVNMRSNDVIFGFKNDVFWQKFIFEKLFLELNKKYKGLKKGKMFWQVGSLHIYERHFDLIKVGETNDNN